MGTSISDQEAQLVGLLVEAILYGFYLVSLGWCVYIWAAVEEPRQRFRIPRILGAASFLLFILATLDITLSSRIAVEAFIDSWTTGGPEAIFLNVSGWTYVTRVAIAFTCVLVVDAVLIYRCYVVCGHYWPIIIVPSVLWMAEAGCIGVIIYDFAAAKNDITGARLQSARSLYIAASAVNVVLTVLATGCITYRITSVSKGTKDFRVSAGGHKTLLQRAYRVLIEAAVPYVILSAVLLVTTLTGTPVSTIISDALFMVVCINFNLITIRVHQQPRTPDASTHSVASIRFAPTTARDSQRFELRTQKAGSLIAMNDMSIDVNAKRKGGSSSASDIVSVMDNSLGV